MAADSSKICHYAPPLLRAFNLSKQPFSLPQNRQDAIFGHWSSVMFTKSPSFPSLSFHPIAPPLSHLTSLTSSVAGKTSDECRDNPIPETAQPVSAGSFLLNRESSPHSFAVGAVAADISPAVRDSSLMQIWRELEEEAGLCPTPSTSTASATPPTAAEEPLDSSDACEESKLSGKEITGTSPAAAVLTSPELSSTPTTKTDAGEKMFNVRGRQELEDFILKLDEEGRQEVAALTERHPVYQFPFRGCVLRFIIPRSSLQSATIITQQRSQKSKSEILRKTNEDEAEGHIAEVPTEEIMSGMKVQISNSLVYVLIITLDHSDSSSCKYEDQHERQGFSAEWQKPLLDEVTAMSNGEENEESGGGKWLLQPLNSWGGWERKE